jgi:hypothetical protein
MSDTKPDTKTQAEKVAPKTTAKRTHEEFVADTEAQVQADRDARIAEKLRTAGRPDEVDTKFAWGRIEGFINNADGEKEVILSADQNFKTLTAGLKGDAPSALVGRALEDWVLVRLKEAMETYDHMAPGIIGVVADFPPVDFIQAWLVDNYLRLAIRKVFAWLKIEEAAQNPPEAK